MLIAQFSDCHIVDRGELFADRIDSAAGLCAAIATINALEPQPDLVLATGDLVNDATPHQYDRFGELVGALRAPLVPLPGNHDDRTELRRRFGHVLPKGEPDEPIDFVIDEFPLRLIALDTTIPGRHDGRLTAHQLEWLDERLTEHPDRQTLIAQHHPPFRSGIAWMDDVCGFATTDDEAGVLRRHRQVEAVVCGHLHRTITRRFAGTVASTCPSTAAQLVLDLSGGGSTRYAGDPTGFVLHEWHPESGLTSHLVPIGEFETWAPAWA